MYKKIGLATWEPLFSMDLNNLNNLGRESPWNNFQIGPVGFNKKICF